METTESEISITLTVAEVRALLAFCSNDSTRPSLCGIGVSGKNMAATNAHVLVFRGDAGDTHERFSLIPRDAIEPVVHGQSPTALVFVKVKDGRFSIACGFASAEGALPEAEFPNAIEVIRLNIANKSKPSKSVMFQGRYLALVGAVDDGIRSSIVLDEGDEDFDRERIHTIWDMSHRGETDPVMLTCSKSGAAATWTVLIMPMRP